MMIAHELSGPVLRDAARLSQRYPAIARYGVLSVSTSPIGRDTPSPFSERFPPWRACEVEVRYPPPPQKGYLSDTGAIPYETKANGCDTPLCDTISKGYCTIWGGISPWASQLTNIHTRVHMKASTSIARKFLYLRCAKSRDSFRRIASESESYRCDSNR